MRRYVTAAPANQVLLSRENRAAKQRKGSRKGGEEEGFGVSCGLPGGSWCRLWVCSSAQTLLTHYRSNYTWQGTVFYVSDNHNICYSNLSDDDVASDHWLMHVKSEQGNVTKTRLLKALLLLNSDEIQITIPPCLVHFLGLNNNHHHHESRDKGGTSWSVAGLKCTDPGDERAGLLLCHLPLCVRGWRVQGGGGHNKWQPITNEKGGDS